MYLCSYLAAVQRNLFDFLFKYILDLRYLQCGPLQKKTVQYINFPNSIEFEKIKTKSRSKMQKCKLRALEDGKTLLKQIYN